MNWKKATLIVTFGVIPLLIFGVLIYDVIAISNGGTEASISSLLITSAYKMPFMVYMIGLFNGILVAHLFWRMKSNKDTIKIDSHKEVTK